MKRITKYSLLLAGAWALLASCHRRPLEDGYVAKARIPIGAVWTVAGIMPQNVTALFYNQQNGKLALEHRFENNDDRIQTYAEVPAGIYTVVIFNEIRGQIRGIGIRGHENLATLEAYAIPNPNPSNAPNLKPGLTNRANSAGYVYEPDMLAAVLVRDFDVSCEMVSYTQDSKEQVVNKALESASERLVGLIPERKVHEFNILIHVDGLKNARMPALVDMKGMAESYGFDTDRSTLLAAIQQFTMNNRTYDAGSDQNGTISAKIHTFGMLGETPASTDVQPVEPVIMDFFFMLVDADKTIVHQQVDATSLIRYVPGQHGATTLELEMKLPEALHNVDPQGNDSGFDTELAEWEVIDVPLPAK